MPMAIEREEDHLGGYPCHAVGQDREEPDQRVERPGIEAGEKRACR